jgi:hypothetical protein
MLSQPRAADEDETANVIVGEPAGSGDPDVLAPEERRAPSVREPKYRQLAEAQRQLSALQQKGVVPHEDSGHFGMARQHTENVEIQRVSRMPRARPRHVFTRNAEQRSDGGVFVIAPLADVQWRQ